MPRHSRDTLDRLCSSVEVFMCGSYNLPQKSKTAGPQRVQIASRAKVPEKPLKSDEAEAKTAEKEPIVQPVLVDEPNSTTISKVGPTPKPKLEPVVKKKELNLPEPVVEKKLTPPKPVVQKKETLPKPVVQKKLALSEPVVEPNPQPKAKPEAVSVATPVPAKARARAAAMLRLSPDPEPVIIEKDPVSVSIRKTHSNERTNLELVSFYEKPGVFIKTIKVGSKFLGTNIQVGMKIVRINGQSCPPGVEETIQLMRSQKEILTLTAVVVEVEDDDFMFKEIKADELTDKDEEEKDDPVSPPRLPVAAAWFACFYPDQGTDEGDNEIVAASPKQARKERIKTNVASTERDRIGLGLADRMLKTLGVIDQDEMDYDSVGRLSTFDEISTFKSRDDENTFATHGASTRADDENTFTTYADSTLADGSPILAKIEKKKRRDNVGIHLVSFKKRAGVFVYRIHKDSEFQQTDLEPGMKILSVNGEQCPESVGDTLALLKSVKGELIIEAMYPSNEGGVANNAPPIPRYPAGTSTKTTDLPSNESTQHKMNVKIPSTIGISEEKEEQEEDNLEKKEEDDDDEDNLEKEEVDNNDGDNLEKEKEDDDDDDESCIYESLPPPRYAATEDPKATSWKALAACAVGKE
eukprot:scaffold26128_cov157-Cylindrotheca_fusiformis.AAC.4